MIRKTIPALLLATCLPAIALAAPASNSDASLKGPGFGPEPAPFNHRMGPHGPNGGDRCPGFKGPNASLERMPDIKLTPEQNQSMRKIAMEQEKTSFEIKKKYFDKLSDADKNAMLSELKQNQEDGMKKIRALLTPEQQKKMDERKQRQQERMKEWQEFQAWKAQKEAAK